MDWQRAAGDGARHHCRDGQYFLRPVLSREGAETSLPMGSRIGPNTGFPCDFEMTRLALFYCAP